MSDEAVDARVRRRLRELRTEQELTLQQVADRAGMDVSTLSRLEGGKRRLALDHIPPLAAALGVSADELLRDPARAGSSSPAAAAAVQRDDDVAAHPPRPAGGLHAHKIVISAERAVPPDPLPTHEGQEWLYVISGRMRLILDDHDHVIEPGEAVEFSTWTPHWFGAVDGPVEVIGIFGPQGERVHFHR